MAERDRNPTLPSGEELESLAIWSSVGEQPRHRPDQLRIGKSDVAADPAHCNQLSKHAAPATRTYVRPRHNDELEPLGQQHRSTRSIALKVGTGWLVDHR